MKNVFKNQKVLRFGQIVITVVLLWFVSKKIDLVSILHQVLSVPVWYLVTCVFFWLFSNFFVCYRWSIILFGEFKMTDVFFLLKNTLISNFYAFFLPSSMSADLIKWVPLRKKYPDLSKADLASSVLLDRFIGFTSFITVAFGSVVLGRLVGLDFPILIFWLFLGGFVGVIVFYLALVFYKLDLVLEKVKLPIRLKRLILAFVRVDKKRIIKALLLSFLVSPAWTLSGWLGFVAFKTQIPILPTMIVLPIINLLLILPVSIAGFGAREGLYVFFFSKWAISPESVLAVSAFSGIIGIVFSLLGGLLVFL